MTFAWSWVVWAPLVLAGLGVVHLEEDLRALSTFPALAVGLRARRRGVLRRLDASGESGVAVPSYTTLNGRYCLRVAISNH